MGAHTAVAPGLALSGQRTALGMVAVGAGAAAISATGTSPTFSLSLADAPVTVVQSVGSHLDPISVLGTMSMTESPSGLSGGPVVAQSSHEGDARSIAALARSVEMHSVRIEHGDQTVADEQPTEALSALALPVMIGGVSLSGLGGSRNGVAALERAATELGKPYVWGAAGPNSFDCSGLVQWAYRQIGIHLPRTSSAQSQVGTPVSRNHLRPGDLVFFYSDTSHVGIYLGNGKILNASESGKPVKVSSMENMPYHSARRL